MLYYRCNLRHPYNSTSSSRVEENLKLQSHFAYWCELEVSLTSRFLCMYSRDWQGRVSPCPCSEGSPPGCFQSWPHVSSGALHCTPASPMFSEFQTQFLALRSVLHTEVGQSSPYWSGPGHHLNCTIKGQSLGLWAKTMGGAHFHMSPQALVTTGFAQSGGWKININWPCSCVHSFPAGLVPQHPCPVSIITPPPALHRQEAAIFHLLGSLQPSILLHLLLWQKYLDLSPSWLTPHKHYRASLKD